MVRTHFMLGISALAFAASAASAQTTTANGDTTDPNTGNRVVVSCTANNSCSVTQQQGTTFSSSASANASGGTNNTSTINQTGNRQYAESRATGDRNLATVQQTSFNNTSSISQTGSVGTTGASSIANRADVVQGAGNGTGNNNISQVVQVRTSGAADSAGVNVIGVNQANNTGGFNNVAIQTQNGTNNTSFVNQNDQQNLGVAANNNSATVLQLSAGARSDIFQAASGNVASVSMFGGNNTPNTAPFYTNGQEQTLGGPVTGANVSYIFQTNSQFQAGSTSGTFAAGAPTTANNPNTGNLATIAIAGLQNNSRVIQRGVQNTVDQSLLNGGPGNTSAANASGTNPGTGDAFPANRPEGNNSSVSQTGRGNYAATSIGGRVTTGGGSGNISTINQTQNDAAVTQTSLNSTMTASTAHRALVYMRGILDQVSITQTNNAFGGNSTGAAGTTQSGSLADVSTLSFNSSASVNQTGTNTARVTQGSRTETTGANNIASIFQTDAGDIVTSSTSGGTGGGFGGTAGTTTTTTAGIRNFGEIVQYGIENQTYLFQNAINASATVFQAVGTRNNYTLALQGTNNNFGTRQSTQQQTALMNTANRGANSQNLIATNYQTAGQGGESDIIQNGRNLTASATQQGGVVSPAGAAVVTANNSNNVILLAQAYDYSSATVSQNGRTLFASIEQRGTGTAARPNLVTITQTGGGTTTATGNTALARQTQNVGPSDANGATAGVPNDVNFPFSRAGANSAEIVILQSGTGGSATVEQRGKGQYASITQTGTRNTGGILQDTAATNAVAVLTQSGTDNTYYITQSLPGQYIRVTQSGTDNTASIINGPSGPGNNNAATPQTPPAGGFGGVQ